VKSNVHYPKKIFEMEKFVHNNILPVEQSNKQDTKSSGLEIHLWDLVTRHLVAALPAGWRRYLLCFLFDTNFLDYG